MEQKAVTVEEVIDMTISELRELYVPAEYLDAMGPHIARALNNLKSLKTFLNNKENEKQEDPEIEFVDAGYVSDSSEDSSEITD